MASILIFIASCSNDQKGKNILNVYSQEVITTVDPIEISDRHSHAVAKQVYEGLYEFHYLKPGFELYPALAESLPEITNKLTYTIKLKKGVLFADDPCFKKTGGKGREFTAQDFIYSIKRLLSSEKSKTSFVASIILEVVKDFKALDDYTVQFKLKRPSAYFPTILIRPGLFVVAKEAVDYYGKDFRYHPVGTGAFKIEQWEKNSKVVFVRNQNYHHGFYPKEGGPEDDKNGMLKDAGEPLPFLNKIVRYILVEEKPRWLKFNKGDVDIVALDKDSYYDAFPTSGVLSKDLQDKGINVIKMQRLETTYYIFNMEDKLIGSNKYLRQAISLAYDGQKHNALFYNNQAFVANWVLPPGIFGFDPSYKNPYRQYNANLKEAKRLLAKAGYPNGKGLPTIKLLITDSVAAKQMGELFAKSMADIGIKAELVSMNFSLELQELEKTKRRFHIASLQWKADLPFAEDFLRIFYSKAFTPGPNDSHFKNSEYDLLFDKASQMGPGPEKMKILNRMRDIAVEECSIIPVINPVSMILTQPYVHNYRSHVIVGDDYKYVRVDHKKIR